jgi:hypothetical protein
LSLVKSEPADLEEDSIADVLEPELVVKEEDVMQFAAVGHIGEEGGWEGGEPPDSVTSFQV